MPDPRAASEQERERIEQVIRARAQTYLIGLLMIGEEGLSEQEKIAITLFERQLVESGIDFASLIAEKMAHCRCAFWQETVRIDPNAPVPELPEIEQQLVEAQRKASKAALEAKWANRPVIRGS